MHDSVCPDTVSAYVGYVERFSIRGEVDGMSTMAETPKGTVGDFAALFAHVGALVRDKIKFLNEVSN